MATQTTKPGNFFSGIVNEFKEAGIFEKVIFFFYLFIPVAILARFVEFPPLVTFFASAFAIVPLAKLMGEATESLSSKTGPTIGGLLNATFGNAVELIIAIIALSKGLNEVVKASITGSIIGNILFVMGMAMFAGGIGFKRQKFNRIITSANSTQLTLACIALIMPSIFVATSNLTENGSPTRNLGQLTENLSLAVAAILIISYAAQLYFTLRTHAKEAKVEEVDQEAEAGQKELDEQQAEHGGHWSVRRSLITLFVATIIVGFISEIMVSSIEPLTKELGWTELFVGVILVAVIGNAAEHLSAVSVAMKNQMTLSLNIAIGSTTQVALFVAPVLVFVGFFLGGDKQLTLAFEEFELVAIIVAVIIANFVTQDNESNWFEGLQLLAAYAIIGVAFFLHP